MQKFVLPLIVGMLLAASPSQSHALTPFKAGYLASPGHVLYFVAKEKGFFEEEGLDVDLFLFNNSGEGMNSIMSGKLDVGTFGTTAPLKFIEKGGQFTMFGGQMENGGSGLVAKPERQAEFQNLSNLKGKKIGVVRLSTGDVVLRGALMREGIDWKKDLTLIELDSPGSVLEAVKKGSIDAGMVWSPHLKNCEKQGLKTVMYTDQMEKDHSCCRQTALTKKLTDHPDEYVHFLRALIKAYRFYQTEQDATVDIIAEYVKVDKEVIRAETYGGHCASNPDPGKKGSLRFWENAKAVGYIDPATKIDINQHLNISLYKQALDSILVNNSQDKIYLKMQDNFVQRNIL